MKTKTITEKWMIENDNNIRENQIDINNTYQAAGVRPVFQNHYVNSVNPELSGCEEMIIEILTKNGASFSPAQIDAMNDKSNDLHDVSKAEIYGESMFTSEIEAAADEIFRKGGNRYRYIHAYLSIIMFKNGKVGKIKLTKDEDKPRPCFKPRCKWYLIQQ